MKRAEAKRISLLAKAREAMLQAVQTFNNPLVTFRTESFIVLSMIAWTYLLHAHYKKRGVDHRYYEKREKRKRYVRNPDGSYRFWELARCLDREECPLDENTKANLRFLVGLRNHIEHHKPTGLDSYLSARYQACALNFNYYLKELHGEQHGLDQSLALAIQFAELDYNQSDVIKDREKKIPRTIIAYVAGFDSKLTTEQLESERYAYRLLFTKVAAKRSGQADRVIEFIDPKSDLAKTISQEFWVMKETEKPKFLASQVVKKIQEAGFKTFGMHRHTMLWKEHDAKNPDKGYGTLVANYWYWYQKWIDFLMVTLTEEGAVSSAEER